jgi:hypothetical protein
MTLPIEWEWVRCFNKFARTDDSRGIIAYWDNTPCAAVTMHNWENGSVELHQVVTRPMVMRHNFLEIVAAAVFGEDRHTAYGIIPENSKALPYNRKLGFKETGRIPNGRSSGVDYIIQCLAREDCKYLKENQNA